MIAVQCPLTMTDAAALRLPDLGAPAAARDAPRPLSSREIAAIICPDQLHDRLVRIERAAITAALRACDRDNHP